VQTCFTALPREHLAGGFHDREAGVALSSRFRQGLNHGVECDLCLSSRALYLIDRNQQPIALSREVLSRAAP
jgi:hypothetical protein